MQIENIQQFNEISKSKSFLESYILLKEALNYQVKLNQTAQLEFYDAFCENFPFNYQYWNSYAQIDAFIVTQQKDKKDGLKQGLQVYKRSVQLNPYCSSLWHCAIHWIEHEFKDLETLQDDQLNESQKLYFINQAIEKVGTDYNSYVFWKKLLDYYASDTDKCLEIYNQVLNLPINGIQECYKNFYNLIKTTSEDQVKKFYQMYKKAPEESLTDAQLREIILQDFQRIEKQIMTQVTERAEYESILQALQFDPDTSDTEWATWCKYLDFMRGKNQQAYVYLLKRALVTNCQRHQLWIQYFDVLQSDESVLQFFDLNYNFFLRLGGNTLYYILDLLEKTDPKKAEKIYLEQTANKKNANFYMRYIQFLIRENNQEQVLKLFDTIKKQFKEQTDLYVWIISEQAKYYGIHLKDAKQALAFLEKALKENDYNYYLYSFYLQFIVDHCQDKLIENILSMFRNICFTNKLTQEIQSCTQSTLRSNNRIPLKDIRTTELKMRQVIQESQDFWATQKLPKRDLDRAQDANQDEQIVKKVKQD